MKFPAPRTAAIACATALALNAVAQPAGTPPKTTAAADKHRQEDIAKHRTLAQAHEAAARCLESGEKETVCYDKMRAACQGIAIGKFCGMRHGH